ncbi:hypothetical protein P3S68_015667 [Capsicum galapagoense]
MLANLLRTLLRKLEPLFAVPFDLATSPTANHLRSCHSLAALKWLHAVVLTTGHYANVPVCTKLVYLVCSLSPTMDYAQKLFDQMPQRDMFAWNTLIRGYSNMSPCQEAIILYKDMHFQGYLPDNYTFSFILRSCSVLSSLREGRELYCNIIKYGLESNMFIQSSLITLYAQSGETLDSELVFDQMRVRN